MKHEIIYTEQYALIVSDEQAKESDWGYIPFQGGDVKLVGKYFADDWKKIIAHRPLTDAPILEGVALLLEFSEEEDIDELSKKEIGWWDKNDDDELKIFKRGYNKAKEQFKYTEDDLRKAIELAREGRVKPKNFAPIYDFKSSDEEIIQSIQQTKRPKYFETVCDCQECGANKTNLSLDMGCENKIATLTNSQGKTELVGEFIY